MSKFDDLLIELRTEELPPKQLRKLGEAFLTQIENRLEKNQFTYKNKKYFATPRRLAVLFEQVANSQPDQTVERKGPAIKAAFDANGKPTKACEGFAKSCGVSVNELIHIKNSQGEWLGYNQHVKGKTIAEVLPQIVDEAALALPAKKRMRWNDGETQFIRPIHGLVLLYGDKIIPAKILEVESGRTTLGHRFMSDGTITIPHASAYESLLETEGFVIADFEKRRDIIKNSIMKSVAKLKNIKADLSQDLLDEVTGLVEWPVVLIAKFDERFLNLPSEILISAMQAHQRYFPLTDNKDKLANSFIIVSNMQTSDASQIIHGNERVIRARLADAEFFYNTDRKEKLENNVAKLKGIIFQAKLGSLYEKTERLKKLATMLAEKLNVDTKEAERAGLLSKTDLLTDMVNEFPELQGTMGEYYALHEGESKNVSMALREQYLPRFSGDNLPQTKLGQILAIADRMDTLVGVFGIGEIPTGDKDPYGLRRAAIGVLRILIEEKLALDLKQLIIAAQENYSKRFDDKQLMTNLLNFMQERLRAWYLEQGVSADVFAAVSALNITQPLDMDARIKAVQAFKKLKEAETLSIANKRVSNILAKYEEKIAAHQIDPHFFENESELKLAKQLELKDTAVKRFYQSGKYEEALLSLAELREPIDDFFDHVMVMTDDKARRENRILMLSKLRALFLQVADIALLQQ